MKRILKVMAVVCLSVTVLSLAGCNEGQSTPDVGYSIEKYIKPDITVLAKDVPHYSYFYVVDNKTGVVYIQFYGYRQAGITVLMNPDGTPVLADQIKRENSK